MTDEYPQVLTHKLRETEYFARQTKEEQQRITEWLLVNGYINIVEGVYDEQEGTTQVTTSPGSHTIYSARTT